MRKEERKAVDFRKLPIGQHAPEIVNAIVEIPKGEANKYEYDTALQLFRLDRPLYSSVHYPCEYGFVPGTLGNDGDALDILIIVDRPSFTGCLVEARPIGMLDMVDQGTPDQKILAVAAKDPESREIHSHADLSPHLLREIEHFFSVYKELEGKETKVAGWKGREEALRVVREAQKRFIEQGERA